MGQRLLLNPGEDADMVHAYIMVKTGAGSSEDVQGDIAALAGVLDAHVVAGEFDIIVEATGEEVYDVLSTASKKISAMEDVTDTKTYVSLSA
jgi:DNA-binding Lrp family transcriptional regulator